MKVKVIKKPTPPAAWEQQPVQDPNQPQFAYGGQTPYPYLGLDISNRRYTGNTNPPPNPFSVNNSIEEATEDTQNIEAEKGETLVRKLSNGNVGKFNINGKPHSQGGTPIEAMHGDFIYSTTKKMAIGGPILSHFGKDGETNKKYTPAELSKQYDINKYQSILQDPKSDTLQKKTAERMIENYANKLQDLAITQESKKGFPTGIPTVAKMGGCYDHGGDYLTPEDKANWNAFHTDLYQNNPAYGTDVLNHNRTGENYLNQWNTTHPNQAITKPINLYQQNFDNASKEGFSKIDDYLGSKTAGSSFNNWQYIKQRYQTNPDTGKRELTPYYQSQVTTQPLTHEQFASAGEQPIQSFNRTYTRDQFNNINGVKDTPTYITPSNRETGEPDLTDEELHNMYSVDNAHAKYGKYIPKADGGGDYSPDRTIINRSPYGYYSYPPVIDLPEFHITGKKINKPTDYSPNKEEKPLDNYGYGSYHHNQKVVTNTPVITPDTTPEEGLKLDNTLLYKTGMSPQDKYALANALLQEYHAPNTQVFLPQRPQFTKSVLPDNSAELAAIQSMENNKNKYLAYSMDGSRAASNMNATAGNSLNALAQSFGRNQQEKSTILTNDAQRQDQIVNQYNRDLANAYSQQSALNRQERMQDNQEQNAYYSNLQKTFAHVKDNQLKMNMVAAMNPGYTIMPDGSIKLDPTKIPQDTSGHNTGSDYFAAMIKEQAVQLKKQFPHLKDDEALSTATRLIIEQMNSRRQSESMKSGNRTMKTTNEPLWNGN